MKLSARTTFQTLDALIIAEYHEMDDPDILALPETLHSSLSAQSSMHQTSLYQSSLSFSLTSSFAATG